MFVRLKKFIEETIWSKKKFKNNRFGIMFVSFFFLKKRKNEYAQSYQCKRNLVYRTLIIKVLDLSQWKIKCYLSIPLQTFWTEVVAGVVWSGVVCMAWVTDTGGVVGAVVTGGVVGGAITWMVRRWAVRDR